MSRKLTLMTVAGITVAASAAVGYGAITAPAR
jgi:hypothetical protein